MPYKKFIIPLVVISFVLITDRLTKQWAVETLKGMPAESYLSDTFRIIYAENEGAFLSLGSELPEHVRFWLLAVIPILALVYFGFTLFFSKEASPWQRIAFAFILSGGGSNIIDRIREGKVVDFLNIGIGTLRSGIFNIADMAIMMGLFLILPMAFKSKPSKPEEIAPQDEEPIVEPETAISPEATLSESEKDFSKKPEEK
jgi:signal peptidase II